MKRYAVRAVFLLLLAACNRDIYVGHDEASERAGAQALAAPAPDAGVIQAPRDAAAATPDAGTTPVPPPITSAAPSCTAPSADCDGRADNGCETDLTVDSQHCGACNTACSTPDCVCENGKLALRCPTGHADCDGDMRNGCETDLQTNTDNCGSCKHVCHTNGHDVVTAMCVAGQCEMTCEPRVSPETDCDHNPDNGCETYLWFDANNCGQCGNRCTTMCEAGVCML